MMYFTRRLATRLIVATSVLTIAISSELTFGQPLANPQLEVPVAENLELICETDSNHLGGGAQTNSTTQVLTPAEQQAMLIETLTSLDIDRNGEIDHRELKMLDYMTRKQLLMQLDSNLDHQISPQELSQSGLTIHVSREISSTPEPETRTPPPVERFRNLRRFGIGAPQLPNTQLPNTQIPSTQRRQLFSRAAQFGTTPNFNRSGVGRSSRGVGHSIFRATGSDSTGSCRLRITSRP